MPTEHKAKVIETLEDSFGKASSGIITEYRGIPTPELNILRRKLREAGIDFKVVKNTLAQIAATKVGREDVTKAFVGPVAVVIGYDDVSKPAKVLTEHIRASKSALKIKAGFLKGKVLTAQEVQALAALPSREILISQVLAGMLSPIAMLITCLASPMRGLVGTLEARRKQLEAMPAPAPAATAAPEATAAPPAPEAPPASAPAAA